MSLIETQYKLKDGRRLFAFRAQSYRNRELAAPDDIEFWPCVYDEGTHLLINRRGEVSSNNPIFGTLDECLAFLASLVGPPKSPEQREAELRAAGWE
jgi:hypothetical protein